MDFLTGIIVIISIGITCFIALLLIPFNFNYEVGDRLVPEWTEAWDFDEETIEIVEIGRHSYRIRSHSGFLRTIPKSLVHSRYRRIKNESR